MSTIDSEEHDAKQGAGSRLVQQAVPGLRVTGCVIVCPINGEKQQDDGERMGIP